MKKKDALLIDLKRCTGCMTCTMACKVENNLSEGEWRNRVFTVGGPGNDLPLGRFPYTNMYWIPIFLTKCTFCARRLTEQPEPFCVQNCPMKAMTFGDMADPDSGVSGMIKEIHERGLVLFSLPEFLKTRSSVYYVF